MQNIESTVFRPAKISGEDPTAIRGRFSTRVNRVVESTDGSPPYVQVGVGGEIYNVNFTISELSNFHLSYENGGGEIARSQIITDLNRGEIRCGEATVFQQSDNEAKQIMHRAQEVLALYILRQARSTGTIDNPRLTSVVSCEDENSILIRLNAGFRIIGQEGGSLIMEKSLSIEPLPHDHDGQLERTREGSTPVLESASAESVLDQYPLEVALAIPHNDTDSTSRQLITQVLTAGYIGTGLLRSAELDGAQSLLIFQKKDSHPMVERLDFSLLINNEYGKLGEVIVSFPPVLVSEDPADALNDTSKANAGNIDPFAIQEEHRAFVQALVDQGVKIIRTSALGDSTGLYPRDPAFILGDDFVIGKLFREQRQYETEAMKRIAEGLNLADLSAETEAIIEGGDVLPLSDNIVIVGIGKRTNMAGFQKLVDTFPNKTFIGVEHSDLHLDILLAVVGDKKILADTTKLPDEFIAWLESEDYQIITSDPNEPLGVNVVAVNNNRVIAAKENRTTNSRLKSAGVEVIEVSMPNLIKIGGGPHCLTCPTNRD